MNIRTLFLSCEEYRLSFSMTLFLSLIINFSICEEIYYLQEKSIICTIIKR